MGGRPRGPPGADASGLAKMGLRTLTLSDRHDGIQSWQLCRIVGMVYENFSDLAVLD